MTASCFLLTVRAKPGEQYVYSCYVMSAAPEGALIQLFVQWHDAEGKWFEARKISATLLAGETDCWQRLQTFFTAPEGAAAAVTYLVTYDQGETGSVTFGEVLRLRLDIPTGTEVKP